MLKSIRKSTKIFIWIAAVLFVLAGVFTVGAQFQKQGRVAGTVFGQEVTFQEFNRFYKSAQIFSLGDAPARDANAVHQTAWQSLIYAREAKRMNVEVSDDETRAEVLRLLGQAKIQNPSAEEYKRWLKGTLNETPQEFESQVRELLRIRKLVANVQGSGAAPPDEAVHRKFIMTQNQVSLEKVSFETFEKAEAFRKEIKSAKDWDGAVKKAGLTPVSTGFLTMESFMLRMDVSEADAFKFLKLEKGDVGEAVRFGKEFAVARLTDKVTADEANYEKKHKEKLTEEMKQETQSRRFLEWHIGLLSRADLKDYIQPPPAAPAAETPAKS